MDVELDWWLSFCEEGKYLDYVEVESKFHRAVFLDQCCLWSANGLLDGTQSSDKKNFEDDAKIYRRIDTQRNKDILLEDIDKLEEWINKRLLIFSENICNVARSGRKNGGCMLRMEGAVLEKTEGETDLGMFVTPNLMPSDHGLDSFPGALQEFT